MSLIKDKVFEQYIKMGFVVHPLSKPDDKGKSPGKRPLLSGWQTLTKTPDDIDDYLKKGNNIGLVCGKASGVTVIDHDHFLFAEEIYGDYELNTLRSARTKGRGHAYFKYNPDLPAQKHHDLGVEILSDGSNAVLPPSIHTSGDVYKWNDINTPIIQMPKKLEDNLKKLFKTEAELKQMLGKCRQCFRDVIKKNPDMHGADGREYMLAVCTDLKARGAREEHIKMFAKLMYGSNYNEGRTLEEWKNIDDAKTWQCETLRSKLPAYIDLSKCKKCDDAREISKEYDKNTARDSKNGLIPELSTDEINKLSCAERNRRLELSLPEDHFLTQYVKWISSISDGYSEYSVACGLWVLSAVTRGKFVLPLKQEKIKPNLWIFNIGKSTTSRKSTIVNMTRRITECATDCILPNQDYSLEGYLEYLSQHPITNNVRDEAAGLLFKFHQKYNDGIFDLECQLYDGQNIEKTLASKGKKEPHTFKVIDPFVTKLYATTPENLSRALGIDDFLSGYGYRWMFSYPNYPHVRKPLEIESPEDVKAWGHVLTKIKTMYNDFNDVVAPVNFGVTKEAMVFFDLVCRDLEEKVEESNNDILNSVIGRSEIHILKIAMLLELGKAESSTVIDINSIEIAAKMVTEFFIPSIMDLISQLQEDLKNNKIEKLTVILRRLGGNAHGTKLLRDSNMVGKEFRECIETMLESGKIKAFKNSESKGTIYILQDHTEKLKVRSSRKVRTVRSYIEVGGIPTNITNNDTGDENNINKNVHIYTLDAHQGVESINVLTNFTNFTKHTNFLKGDKNQSPIDITELIKNKIKEKFDLFNKPNTILELECFKENIELYILDEMGDIQFPDDLPIRIINDYCHARGWS